MFLVACCLPDSRKHFENLQKRKTILTCSLPRFTTTSSSSIGSKGVVAQYFVAFKSWGASWSAVRVNLERTTLVWPLRACECRHWGNFGAMATAVYVLMLLAYLNTCCAMSKSAIAIWNRNVKQFYFSALLVRLKTNGRAIWCTMS